MTPFLGAGGVFADGSGRPGGALTPFLGGGAERPLVRLFGGGPLAGGFLRAGGAERPLAESRFPPGQGGGCITAGSTSSSSSFFGGCFGLDATACRLGLFGGSFFISSGESDALSSDLAIFLVGGLAIFPERLVGGGFFLTGFFIGLAGGPFGLLEPTGGHFFAGLAFSIFGSGGV